MAKKKYKRAKQPRYVGLPFVMLEHPNYQALSNTAARVFVELRHRYNGHNNGAIGLSCRDAGIVAHCSRNTAQKALNELEHYGFIIRRRVGTFGNRKASEFILTCEPYNQQPPAHDWKLSCPDFQKNTRHSQSDLSSRQRARNDFMAEQMVTPESRID
jgi:hypothetical protein